MLDLKDTLQISQPTSGEAETVSWRSGPRALLHLLAPWELPSWVPRKGQPLTWAAQMLYWVNMASYSAISPLCPAAAQARASKTGIACNTPIDKVWVGGRKGARGPLVQGVGKQHSPSLSAGSAPSAGPAARSGTGGSHGASAACQKLRLHWLPASFLGLDSVALTPDVEEEKVTSHL